jgi:hypothetical protein
MLSSTTEILARNSLQWKDDKRFFFLWGSELVIVHYEPDKGLFLVISNHDEETEKDIQQWLAKKQHLILEEHDGDEGEENSD